MALILLGLLGACATRRYPFTEGPLRLHLHVPMAVEVETRFDIAVLFEGVVPLTPVTIEISLDGEPVASAEAVLTSRFFRLQGHVPEFYYVRGADTTTPLDNYRADRDPFTNEPPHDVTLRVLIRYLDETGKSRAIGVSRHIVLTCSHCFYDD